MDLLSLASRIIFILDLNLRSFKQYDFIYI